MGALPGASFALLSGGGGAEIPWSGGNKAGRPPSDHLQQSKLGLCRAREPGRRLGSQMRSMRLQVRSQVLLPRNMAWFLVIGFDAEAHGLMSSNRICCRGIVFEFQE